ncbi:hypothetical protein B484DRAFT_484071, partial [Ochromonadaceae sp. CCMP2298]
MQAMQGMSGLPVPPMLGIPPMQGMPPMQGIPMSMPVVLEEHTFPEEERLKLSPLMLGLGLPGPSASPSKSSELAGAAAHDADEFPTLGAVQGDQRGKGGKGGQVTAPITKGKGKSKGTSLDVQFKSTRTEAASASASASSPNPNPRTYTKEFAYGTGAQGQGQGGRVNANAEYKKHVVGVLSRGGYLNPEEVHVAMAAKDVDLRMLREFHDVQNLDRKVCSAVDAYWHSHSVRTYPDMKAFVIQSLAKWTKQEQPDTFEFFGVGNLSRNTRVVKLFQLFDMGGKGQGQGQGQETGGGEGWEPSPYVGSEQVLQCALQIVHSKRYMYQNDTKPLEDLLLQRLHGLHGPQMRGVQIDAKDLILSMRSATRQWGRQVEQAGVEGAQALVRDVGRAMAALGSQLDAAELRDGSE